MKVKLLTSVSYPDVTYNVGEIIDIDSDEAVRFIEKGFAEPIRSEKKVEKATAAPAKEKAVKGSKKK